MAEYGLALALSGAGIGVLAVLHGRLAPLALASLAFPAGVAVFVVVGLGQLAATGTVFPRAALATTAAIGLVGLGVAAVRRRLGVDTLVVAAVVILGTVAVVAVTVTQHLTRLTPDSLDHLMIAVDLQGPAAMEAIPSEVMLKRQVGLAMIHTLSDLADRQYLSFVSPLFGVAAFGFCAWFIWSRAASLAVRRRWMMVGAAILFLASSNRMLYMGAYVNVHMAMACWLLVAVVALWLATTTDDPAWAAIGGVSLAVTLLIRPEAPLLMGLLFVPMAASGVGRRVRWWLAGPALAVLVPWYSLLWRHAPDGSDLSLTAPVFGSIVIVVAGCMLLLFGDRGNTRRVAHLADRLLLPGLIGLLLTFAVFDPATLGASLWASVVNLGPDLTFRYSTAGSGLWMHATWLAAIILVGLALRIERVDFSRIWRVFIIGFGLLYLLMPHLRGSSWRIGTGDSGNRIVTHALMVMVVFVVLVAVEDRAQERASTSTPRSQRESQTSQ